MKKSILLTAWSFLFFHVEYAIGTKPRYAPKYCLRMKFDCKSSEKKGHVRCLFPLPIEGNGLTISEPGMLRKFYLTKFQ